MRLEDKLRFKIALTIFSSDRYWEVFIQPFKWRTCWENDDINRGGQFGPLGFEYLKKWASPTPSPTISIYEEALAPTITGGDKHAERGLRSDVGA
jgi:hypothetical protein